jgi:hypothetical protein
MTNLLIYPEKRFISDAAIKSWYGDLVADGRICADDWCPADSNRIDLMIEALQDVGVATFAQF